MGKFINGEIVVFPFPFSDLSNYKRRPALVITPLEGDDMILCMITSKENDRHAIPIEDGDLRIGSLNQISFIRPNRLFTGDSTKVIKSVGHLNSGKIKLTIEKIIQIVRN